VLVNIVIKAISGVRYRSIGLSVSVEIGVQPAFVAGY
jgi:hypothetical protein